MSRLGTRCVSEILLLAGALLLLIIGGGCAPRTGPEYLTIDGQRYDVAFDVAQEVARRYGMVPALRDRRTGLIETEPVKIGSLLEPWDRGNISPGRALQSTLAHQRRRARFEFIPAGFDPAARPDEQPLLGPDVFGVGREPIDLTRHEGPVELRAWVYLERSHTVGRRRDTWTRRVSSRTRVIDPETEQPVPSARAWVPIARDPDLEQRLLREIRRRLAES